MPYQLYKRAGSPHIWISVKVKGRGRIRRSSGTPDRKTAKALAERIEAQEWGREIHGDTASLTFAQAVMMYVNEGHSDAFTIPLVRHFKDMLVADMRGGHIRAAARAIYPDAKPATWNRQVLTPCQAIINYAASKDLAASIKVERFKELRPVKKAPGEGWMTKFLVAATPEIAALALFMQTTGARIGQALAITWGDVDFSAQVVVIPAAKGFPDRRARLIPEVVAILANLPGERSGLVFRHQHRWTVYPLWKAACEAAGIAYIGPHSAGRRAFATEMQRKGIGPKTAARLGGWSSVKLMLEIYADADEDPAIVDSVFSGTNQTQRVPHAASIGTDQSNKIKRIV